MSAKPQRSSSPLTSFEAPRGQIPVVLVLGPLGLCNCFDIFHPFCHHIFFSSPFCRMLLRSKNSKSTAPLTLISMPRCVLRCQDFSASFLPAALSLQSSLTSPLSTQAPPPHPDCCPLQPPAFGLSGNGKCSLSGSGFAFFPPESILILENWVLFLECLKS